MLQLHTIQHKHNNVVYGLFLAVLPYITIKQKNLIRKMAQKSQLNLLFFFPFVSRIADIDFIDFTFLTQAGIPTGTINPTTASDAVRFSCESSHHSFNLVTQHIQYTHLFRQLCSFYLQLMID